MKTFIFPSPFVGKRNSGKTKHGLQWFLLDMGGHLVDFIQKHGEMAQ